MRGTSFDQSSSGWSFFCALLTRFVLCPNIEDCVLWLFEEKLRYSGVYLYNIFLSLGVSANDVLHIFGNVLPLSA